MSRQTTRLMVLGVVAYRGPISGYGIEKTLDEWAVSRWTTIAAASVYQQLRTLTAAGFIEPSSGATARAVDYACTPAGTAELHRLLLELLHERDVRPLSLIPLLHFTPSLEPGELHDGLALRIARIDEALALEDEFLNRSLDLGPSHATEIFRLTWHGLRADKAWCEGFRRRLLVQTESP
ncbi:PadR family transcriptional regulator [Humibacter ginsenosidimutans]|uniref:PadR family transcriptional regulator n=1 Tax=Humibacter ginsenosidimutans TaxID=2599293 RepID=A0A5B8M3I4_9MICO|nr:PadR family transcriptional regulator [Humibacter ginsenosidimutans]QDZ14345.1 PadR family transcriptional regulator [Humibacter ginsenosidimutans]